EVRLAVATHGEPQPARQRIDARDTDAVQAARDLVAVLVELAAGVQLGQRDLGGRAARLVLVVHLDLDRDAPTVVADRDRIVRVDGDDDLVAMPRERFVDGVVDDFEHQVVQAGPVGGIPDVHARALSDRLQAFEDLDRGGIVGVVVFSNGHYLLRYA